MDFINNAFCSFTVFLCDVILISYYPHNFDVIVIHFDVTIINFIVNITYIDVIIYYFDVIINYFDALVNYFDVIFLTLVKKSHKY